MRSVRHRRVPPVIVLCALVVGVAPAALDGQRTTTTGGLPPAESVVARHLESIGGVEAFRAVQSVHARGRLEMPGQGILAAFELFTARPAKMLYRVTVPGIGRIENGYDGRVAWTMNPVSGPEVLTGRQLEEAAEDAWFDAPLHTPERVREMTTLEQTTFDGRPAWRIRVVFRTGRELTEYYDVETGRQIGSEASRATPQGIVPTVNVLRDYQLFGELFQATTFVQRAMGFEQIVTITSCEYDQVPDETFALPPAISALVPLQ